MDSPSTNITPAAQPFWLSGGPVGIILVHGYGGSIGDYRAIAKELHDLGYSVRGVRLAGHGQDLEALRHSTVEDWRNSVSQAIVEVQQHCQRVVIVGSSFGGVLALDYAFRHNTVVAGLVLVNTALSYSGGGVFQRAILRTLSWFTPYYPKKGLSSAERQRGQEVGSAPAWPIQGILDTADLARHDIIPNLSKITVPALIVHSAHDPIVGERNSQVLCERLGSTVKDVVALPVATHRPFRDPSMISFMATAVDKFIRQHLA